MAPPVALPALSAPATAPRLTWAAKGRVGPRVASLVARDVAPDLVRVECVNNPSFWMMVDLDTRAAHGCVRGCHRPGTAQFAVRPTARGGLRIDHELAPWFWLELDSLRGAGQPPAASAS